MPPEFGNTADQRLGRDDNCRPDLFKLRDPVPVTRAVKDGDIQAWEGLGFEVVETPGHTGGSVTFLVELACKRLAFTGALIYGSGQIHDTYSLQKTFRECKAGIGDSEARSIM